MRLALVLLTVLSSFTVALPSETSHKRRDAAPQSQTGPPGAADALRDPSKLKFTIVGIVGAYLFWLVATLLLIVFVGNRLRKRALNSASNSNMTMMKTLQSKEQVVEVRQGLLSPGLKSPMSGKLSFKSWGKKGHKANDSTYSTTTLNSVHSSHHEQHKAKDMDDLAKLYAAVMVHDEQKSKSPPLASPPSPTVNSPLSPRIPPELAHLYTANVQSPKSPIFKPDGTLHHPMAPTPTEGSFPQDDELYNQSRASSRTVKNTPLSFLSDASSRVGSVVSTKSRPSRISIRGHTISQPIGSADMHNAQFYEETVPLSPRVYTPGPPPPTPGKKKQVRVSVEPIQEHQPYDEQSPEGQLYPITFSPEPYTPQQSQHPQQAQQAQLHPGQYQPQPTAHLPQSPRDKRVPPALSPHNVTFNTSNATLNAGAMTSLPQNAPKNLPFRDMYGDITMRSAPPTKTTFLERPFRMFSGPKTGVPQTPYSPYTPQTPMTPVTPRRLLGKSELRAKRKEEKLRVLNEDDLVAGDDDVWGSK